MGGIGGGAENSTGRDLVMFSIWDSKAEAYMQPFFAMNVAVAVRMWQEACQDEGSQFWRHSEDYTLFRVGSFDQAKGTVSEETPISIARAHELKEIGNE